MGTIRTLLAVSVLVTHSEPIRGLDLLTADAAVTCFFIVSGFLITLILREKYTDLKVFYVNRGLRIYVPYLTALVLLIVVYALVRGGSHDPFGTLDGPAARESTLWVVWSAISNLTLVGIDLTRYIAVEDQGIVFPSFLHGGGGGGHNLLFVPQAWTLALELQFYLLAPFLVRLHIRKLVVLTGGLLVLRTVVFQLLVWRDVPIDDAALFPMQLCYFLLGALGYHGYRWLRDAPYAERDKRRAALAMSGLALGVILVGSAVLPGRIRPVFDLFYLTFAATVPFLFFLTRRWKLDQRIGEYSYPIYIFHFAIAAVVSELAIGGWTGEVVLVVTVVVSTVYLRLVDEPVQRLRGRLASRANTAEQDRAVLAVS
ncbi:MAG TPA: acyltransferase [Solirubrobacteraceae bacterium]|nr:acyltransferase [Solirubrobacteraceae bacterium]